MADIDVVKKGSRAWIWVLLLIALALVLWFVYTGDTGTRQMGLYMEPESRPLTAAANT